MYSRPCYVFVSSEIGLCCPYNYKGLPRGYKGHNVIGLMPVAVEYPIVAC